MEFRFNFQGEDDDGSNSTDPSEVNESIETLRKCRKHMYNHRQQNNPHVPDDFNKIMKGPKGKALYYLKPEVTTMKIKADDIFPLLQLSDLEPGEYEGGLKVWECTIDLLDYLRESKWLLKNEKVLDLGCGSGLLGLYAYLSGSDKVCFQDFNSEVIEHFTIPSVEQTIHNAGKDMSHAEFLSGDWMYVNKYFEDNKYAKFNLILSSETIYNVKYYSKIKDLLQNHLSNHGVALFAAKKHYFGVGGGTYDFTEYLRADGTFDISVVKTFDDYLPREVLQVRKINVY